MTCLRSEVHRGVQAETEPEPVGDILCNLQVNMVLADTYPGHMDSQSLANTSVILDIYSTLSNYIKLITVIHFFTYRRQYDLAIKCQGSGIRTSGFKSCTHHVLTS